MIDFLPVRASLLQITRHPFDLDFRKPLLQAATRAGDQAMHIQCGQNPILTYIKHSAAEQLPFRNLDILRKALIAKLGQEQPIVLTGVGGAFAPEVERVVRLFRRRNRYYDVQDDLSYGARDLSYLKFLVRDARWRLLCGRTLVLEEGMKRYYPSARHLDNASHIVSRRRPALPIRAVYIGSIDQRLDLDVLEAIAIHAPIDIYGRFHERAGDMESRLKALASSTARIRLLGSYDNQHLEELLQPYSIGLLPYKAPHRLTNHVNPDKIYHYLNSGLAVVSTPIPQAMRLREHIGILTHPSCFTSAVETAFDASASWTPDRYVWDARWSELKSLHRSTAPTSLQRRRSSNHRAASP